MRPKIICHMVGSIDGRLQSDRWTPLVGETQSGIVLKVYEETAQRMQAQAWLVGRKTMATMLNASARHCSVPDTPLARVTCLGNRQGRPLAIAIDPSGKLHYGTDHLGAEHLVAILGEQVSDAYLAELQKDGVSYFFAGPDGRNLDGAMTTLAEEFGIETLLLEGGGTINGAFLQADLIDEISLLLYPGIDGLAGISSIFEYHGVHADDRPGAGRCLRLLSVEVLASDIVWMRYAVERLPIGSEV